MFLQSTANLLCCPNDWSRFLESRQLTNVIYLDMTKAFDMIRVSLELLELFGIRGKFLSWIHRYFSK